MFPKNIHIQFVPINFSNENEITSSISKMKNILNNFYPLSLYKEYIVYSQKNNKDDTICEITSYDTIALNITHFINFCKGQYNTIYIIIIKSKLNKGKGGSVSKYKIPVVIVTSDCNKGIIMHEFSHAVFGLGDEYSGDLPFPPSKKECSYFPNLSLDKDNEEWNEIKEKIHDNLIGYYIGGLDRNFGVYHSYPKCLMQDAKSPLCPICIYYAIKALNKITGLNRDFFKIYSTR